jgi:capsular polysaccharide biosynthesis protein
LQNFPIPEISITYIPNAIVTATGAVIHADANLIAETVEGGLEENGFVETGGVITCDLQDLQSSDEVVLCINRNGTWNYSLFLSEIVPLALICSMNAATAGLRVPMFFREFMGPQAIATRKELLAQFGIAGDMLFSPAAKFTRYRGVVLAKANDRYKNHRVSQLMPHISGKLKAELATPYSPPSRRLYISREASPSRRVENFDELSAKVLQPFDLLPVELDTMPLQEQVDLFAKADLVVAEHGAGLVNAMFMRPGSTLVELVPGPMVGRWMYRLIAHYGRLNYCFGSFEPPASWVWHRDNIVVPCEIYRRLLEHA